MGEIRASGRARSVTPGACATQPPPSPVGDASSGAVVAVAVRAAVPVHPAVLTAKIVTDTGFYRAATRNRLIKKRQ